MPALHCKHCGKPFRAEAAQIKKGRKFCSTDCYHAFRRETSNGISQPPIMLTCEQCGQSFRVHKYRAKTARFCSYECYHNSMCLDKVTLTCLQCGKKFQVIESKAEETKYCSMQCQRASHRKEKIRLICATCGKEFFAVPSKADHKFCSRACLYKALSVTRVCKICSFCGKDFYVIPSRKETAKFCSHECYSKWRSKNIRGTKHPNWKGGYQEYYGPNWREQRNRARKRDGYQCQICGITEKELGHQLDVHHIVPILEFGYIVSENDNYLEANALSNLLSVCQSCHSSIEPRRGNGPG